MKVIILVLFSFSAFASGLLAQPDKHSDNHEHHRNEIGGSNAAVYFIKEQVLAYGIHLHYVHNISNTSFGMGLGYERIFDAHKHNTIALETVYRPIEALSLSLSPGFTFEGGDFSPAFALHFETAYEFEFNHFHTGPAIEFAYDPEDYHLSLGLHIGYEF